MTFQNLNFGVWNLNISYIILKVIIRDPTTDDGLIIFNGKDIF